MVSEDLEPLNTLEYSVLFMKTLDNSKEFLIMDLIVTLRGCIML